MSSRIDLPDEFETAAWQMKVAICYLTVLKKAITEKEYENGPYWIEKVAAAERDAAEKRLYYERLKSARCKETAE